MLLRPAETIGEIADTCSPQPLSGAALGAFFVETDAARSVNTHLRERLKQLLADRANPRRILVCSHRGCGKSTELNQLRTELGSEWFVVGFSLREALPPVGVRAEDILGAVAVALLDQARDTRPPLEVGSAGLDGVVRFFSEVTGSQTQTTDAKGNLSASAGVGDGGFWSALLSLSAKLKAELQVGSRREKSIVHHVRQRPSELLAAVNAIIEKVQAALDPTRRRLLIIIEDLDKLDLKDAHEVFVRNSQLLARLHTSVLYTIPTFTFYSADAPVIRAAFDAVVKFPMLKVADRNGQKAEGFGLIEQIVRRRVTPAVLDDDALDLLIRSTGGVLRHVFDALTTAGGFTRNRDERLTKEHIRAALNEVRNNLGVAIGYPRDEKGENRSPRPLYERLVEIAQRQASGHPAPPENDHDLELLLKSGALIEYNGDSWLGVHPLAREYLVALGYDPGPDPYKF